MFNFVTKLNGEKLGKTRNASNLHWNLFLLYITWLHLFIPMHVDTYLK